MFLELLIKLNNEILPLVYKILLILSPILVPILLIYIFGRVWVNYVQLKYISSLKSFLYEIKIPKDIQKSPLAMEIILGAMQAGGAGSYQEAFLQGKVAGWFSLELASFGGDLHFYIWSSEGKFKDILQAQIYAQYPTVEINILKPDDDYVRKFKYNPDRNSLWGLQFGLSKADAYPIKTYVDYGLDKDQKDEYRIDPMTAILELMGSLGQGQQMWLQILIKKHGEEGWKSHRLKTKPSWVEAALKEIEKIRLEATPQSKGEFPSFPNPTKGQVEKIAAIERSLSKAAFDTMVRGLYLAEKESFNSSYISGLIGSMKQYNSETLNGFKLKFTTDVSDNFKDWCVIFPFLNKNKDRTIEKFKKQLFNAYRLRSYFYPPYKNYKNPSFVLTSEELATIYHFPGNVSATPTLAKIPSKKSEPPANLPIKK